MEGLASLQGLQGMRWESVQVPPPKDGTYYTWHRTYGKCTMGYRNGWGPNPPEWWMENDGCPKQAVDGSFELGGLKR